MNVKSRRRNSAYSKDRRKFLAWASSAVAASASALAIPRALAQGAAYPARPVTLVVTFPAASATDFMGRTIAAELSVHLGQSVIVENKSGAGGSIGATAVARAKNDGYTLGLGSNSTMAINRALYRNLPYDPLKDFIPIIKTGTSANLLVAPGQSSIGSVQELIARLKENKKVFQYSSSGNGTIQHLQAALLTRQLGVSADHVPYRSPADQLLAVIAGRGGDFSFASTFGALPYIKDGRMRGLGITTLASSPLLPDVPSLSSAGLKDFEKTNAWWGVVAPSGTPDAVIQTLYDALVKTVNSPTVQSKLRTAGFEPVAATPAGEFAQYVREQVAFYADLVKASGATVD
jgi:tripartite-type tricarboxylate transporter receptor subunit TctC